MKTLNVIKVVGLVLFVIQLCGIGEFFLLLNDFDCLCILKTQHHFDIILKCHLSL